ncbi:Lipase [Smithella sp. ME-1]|uniref:Lipase n=1 Tax=hydrocarbon metagenome TaxID=938273 RepID=A0A0W8FMT5_9ZZZZ|nr:Lipase [Smithella sp. ME-1]
MNITIRFAPHPKRLLSIVFQAFVILIILLPCIIFPMALQAQKNTNENKAYVVLLHGLGRTHRTMWFLEHNLKKHGYEVINQSYPSTKYAIDDLAKEIGTAVEQRCTDPQRPVHFVTHSLGGIVLRHYLAGHPSINLGRVVMLSPPNQGSELANIFQENSLITFFGGPVIKQLGTCPTSIPNQLGPVYGEVGVITGDKSLNPLFSYLIPGKDDGTVSVESTKVEGMRDFLVVHRSHTFIMNSTEVISQVLNFLQQGKFIHNQISG